MIPVRDEIRAHYEGYYGGHELAAWRRLGALDKAENIIELCRGLEIRTMLDVGCGDGSIIERLAECGFAPSRHGIDISVSGISAARSKRIQGAHFDAFDGVTLPFRPKQFDLVVMSHVVEHLEHPRVLLREAQRVGSYVIVEVPCEHTIRLPRDYRPDPVGHINFYTPVTIRRLVQTCGFEVDKQIVRGCSLAVMRFNRPWTGMLQHAVRQTALKLMPPIAPKLFVYHTALLCH